MEVNDKDYIKQRLKMAFWDCNYTEDQLYAVLYEHAQIQYLDKERIYQRLMETYSWNKLIELVPKEQLEVALTEKIINRLRAEALRNRYYHVARILRETALPAPR